MAASVTTWSRQCSMIADNDLRSLRQSLDSGGYEVFAASPEAQFSLLHVAARFGRTIIIEELLATGMHVDVPDLWGHTPLHYASLCGHKHAIVALIQSGAQTSRRNDMGHTPLDYAASEEAAAILRRFFSRSAARTTDGEGFPEHVSRLHRWLAHNRCEQYLDMFLVSGFDDLEFIKSTGLSDADLDAIGVHKAGHRKKLASLHMIHLFLPAPTNSSGGSGESEDSQDDESDSDNSDSSDATSSSGSNSNDDGSGESSDGDSGSSSDSGDESSGSDGSSSSDDESSSS